MILQPFDFVIFAWLFVALLSAAYVAYDQFRNNPEAKVMKWGLDMAAADPRGSRLS